MCSLKISIAMAFALAALPATASADAFDGTYAGTTDEGQQVSLVIAKGELKSIDGAAVRKLFCERTDPSQPFPNDRVHLPDRVGEFAIEKTRRSSLRNSQFLVGTASPAPESGDRIENSAEGRFGSTADRKPIITLRLFYEQVSDSNSNGAQTDCSGSAQATLNRTSAGPTGRPVTLRRPKNMPGTLKAFVPKLASLGDDGLGISATTPSKLAGGTISVSVRRDPSAKDELRFGSGVLGSASKAVVAKRRTTSFTVDVKRPRRTPSSGDSVPMLVKVSFDPKRGKARSATTKIVVGG
jgi:hypothetical protein